MCFVRLVARDQIVRQSFSDFCGRADGLNLTTDPIRSSQRDVDEIAHIKLVRVKQLEHQAQRRLPLL